MEDIVDLYDILDSAVKDITKRVAKMELINVGTSEIDADKASSLVTTTHGDYVLTIIFHTSDDVLKGITQNMKRGADVAESDIAIYAAEYFNILCGHIISAMNRRAHTAARFGIPKVIKGGYENSQAQGNQGQALYYRCPLGTVKVETYFQSLGNDVR